MHGRCSRGCSPTRRCQALDRTRGGLGLGLAIVRSFVELHHGEVQAHSEGVGRGSTFTVWLPRIAPQATVEAPSEPASARTPGRRVLVVDDNVDAAELLRAALVEGGHTVRIVHDGPQALATLDRFVPDVALLDIGLPVMDGYELARRIHARPELATLPLIAVTGYGQARDHADSRAAGFQAHLVKPIDLEALESELARVLSAGG